MSKSAPETGAKPPPARVRAFQPDIPPHLLPDGSPRHPSRVEPAQWRDPADTAAMERDASGRAGRKIVSGYRTADPLDRLPCDVEHLKAARRLRQDWERGSGAMSGGGDAGKVDSSSDRDGGTVGQLEARRRYQDAVEAVGPRLCAYLLPVVLAGWTVAQMVEKHGGNPMALQGRVMAALDRLVDHVVGNKRRAEPFVAPVLVALVVDPTVTDIGQDRLGRARA